MKVADPQGVEWTVRRQWLPWKFGRRDIDLADGGATDVDLGDDAVGVAVGIGILVVFFLLPILLVVLVAVFEILLLILLVPFAVAVYAAFTGWPLVVRRASQVVNRERVRGWRRSHARIEEIADQIRHGTYRLPAPDASDPSL